MKLAPLLALLILALPTHSRGEEPVTLLQARLDQLKHKAWDALNAQSEQKKKLQAEERALESKADGTPATELRDRWDHYWNVHDYWSDYLGLVFQTSENLSDSLRGNPGERTSFASSLARARRDQKSFETIFRLDSPAPLTMSSYLERKRVIQAAAAVAFYEDIGDFDPSTGRPLKPR